MQLLVLCTALLSASCGGGSGTDPGPVDSSPTASTQPTEQPEEQPTPTPDPDPADPTPGPTPISVSVDWQVVSQWDTGYQAAIRLVNSANAALPSWNLQFDLSGSIQSWWDVTLSSSSATRTATGASWNASIPAGGSVSFGFIGAYPGGPPEPTSCRLNGQACVFAGVSQPPSGPPSEPSPEPPLPPEPPSTPLPPGGGEGFLSMSGATMIDSNGEPVRLTGVNWFGFETANRVVHGLWSRDYRSMLRQVRDLGFNAVRIPWSNAILEPGSAPNSITFSGPDPYDGTSPMNQPLQGKTSMQILDLIIEEAGRQGLKVILDNHSRKPDNFISEGLWYLPDFPESRWIADWKAMAARYRNTPTVAAFDLHNEPHNQASWGGDPSTDFAAAAERAAAAIHSVHPDVIIIVGGVQTYNGISYWWGGNLRGVGDRPLDIEPAKLLYSAHDYGPEVFPQTWFSAPDYPQNLIPLWDETWGYIPKSGLAGVFIGEFGIGHQEAFQGRALQWIQSLMAYMGASSSWTYWSLNPNSGDTGGILKDDWVSVQQWKLDLLIPYQARQFPAEP